MAMDVNAVMDALGARLGTISGLRVFDYATETASPPAAVVGIPVEFDYDFTKGGGSDRAVFPVTVLVGAVSARSARDALGAYAAGSGASSVKAAVDGNLGAVAQTARVMTARVESVQLNGVDYLAAVFDVEVIS